MKRAPRLLFLCSDNSVLSQMAEGLARVLYGSRAVVQSAGATPRDIDPMFSEIMRETHIDVMGHCPKSTATIDPADVDIVIVVERDVPCPPALSDKRQIHWSIDDPRKGAAIVDIESRRTALRQAREELRMALRDASEDLAWVAPASYMNWRAFLDGQPFRGASEVPFYSDAERLRGTLEDDLGPYRLQNAFPEDERDPAFVLVLNSHLSPHDNLRMDKTNVAGFTGSWLGDEIAALCSLENGVRLVAGDATRSQMRDGQWIISGDKDRPTFFPARRSRRAILPRVQERAVLGTSLLAKFPKLDPAPATALVRAARLYRDALWIVESEPELAWLLLVSAIEVAAVHQQITGTPAIDILRQSKPELTTRLDAVSLELVADAFAELLKSTSRFIGFLCRFLPSPPEPRPPEGFQLQWSVSNMKKRFNKVYALRSGALHGGIPFPPPMSWPPFPDKGGEFLAPCETVAGLGASSTGGVWKKEDLPFSLHTFEHIARGALLGWWHGLVADPPSDTAQAP